MFKKICSTLYYSRLSHDMGITPSQLFFASLSLTGLDFSAQSMKAATELTRNFPAEKHTELQLKLAEQAPYFIRKPLCLFTAERIQEACGCLGLKLHLPASMASHPKYQQFKRISKLTVFSGLLKRALTFSCVWNESTWLVYYSKKAQVISSNPPVNGEIRSREHTKVTHSRYTWRNCKVEQALAAREALKTHSKEIKHLRALRFPKFSLGIQPVKQFAEQSHP